MLLKYIYALLFYANGTVLIDGRLFGPFKRVVIQPSLVGFVGIGDIHAGLTNHGLICAEER